MKTVTEFAAVTLRNAIKVRNELTAAGKTAEELPAALGEALKLEGDKLAFLIAAAAAVEGRPADLKRVVVLQLAEGEKAPNGAIEVNAHQLVAEYYPPIEKPGAKGRGGRDDKRGGKGGRGDKRGGKRGGGGGRGGDRDRRDAGSGGGGRGPGGPGRDNRGPRAPRPAGGPPKITPVGAAKPAAPTPASDEKPAETPQS